MKNNFFRLSILLSMMLLSGCSAFSAERNPYSIAADFVMDEESDEYKICGADITFYNHSLITVKEFELVFFLFNSEGEPASECPERLTFYIEKEIGPDEDFKICLNLDSFMNFIPEAPLEIDYLYVSKIVFSDGSVWEDPYGFKAFM